MAEAVDGAQSPCGGFTPLWGARRPAGSTTLMPRHSTMDTTLSELLLVALLIGVVVLSGRA